MLKYTFMLFKLWLNSSRCVIGAFFSWKTASSFGNVWIMGCTWLPNLSTYSLAVIQPWKVIMGPTEYCTTILVPKPSQNLLHVSLLEPGFLGCSQDVNSSWCGEGCEGQLIWPSSHMCFQLSDVQVLWLWHHHLCIWALLSVIRGSATINSLISQSAQQFIYFSLHVSTLKGHHQVF
jgi:hypothetical protein